ncbi:hypothetical protein [Herbaspirillum sp. 1130]|uniref:hypothetical protein n=1 Tax=Herbaspirillum sp. 1130 TaxID=2806562 RepID=UPI001AEB5AD9|nr:hypothetical protein [Herbaspirillum sp. 1130]MBP1318321.1 hypothetical protein [Herbaspirillum sp. 1130]
MKTDEFFGVPEENIEAAQYHQRNARRRLSANVPSRNQIATLPRKELCQVLLDWMTRSATEIIPSKRQIYEVQQVLVSRADRKEILDVVEICTRYIQGEQISSCLTLRKKNNSIKYCCSRSCS